MTVAKKIPFRFLIIGLLFSALVAFSLSFPRNARGATAEELQAQIQTLLQQVVQLQQLLREKESGATAAGTPELSTAKSFQFDLWFGLTNNPEVRRLQEFLIQKGYLASGLNTGGFFSKTLEAVKNYQTVYGLPRTGYFGPLTRAAVNAELFQAQATQNPATTNTAIATPPPPTPSLDVPVLLSENGQYRIYAKPAYDIPKAQRRLQDFINEERLKAGLVPLSWHDGLAEVARLHSQEQAQDNSMITTTKKPCSYPYIRHEGFTKGFNVGDRLKTAGISFRVAGENIAAFSVSKNFVYKYSSSEGPANCPDFPPYSKAPAGESIEQAKTRVQNDIAALTSFINSVREVEWVNKEWLTTDEIAQEIVAGWMASEGHRKNILDARFVDGGIGIAEVNDYFVATHVMMKGS